jgi:hypothetical protein
MEPEWQMWNGRCGMADVDGRCCIATKNLPFICHPSKRLITLSFNEMADNGRLFLVMENS